MTTTRPALTPAQLRVLHLIAEGHTNPEIAKALFLSVNTVKTHVADIRKTLGAHNRAHAVHLAWHADILPDAVLRRTQVVELPAGDVGGVER